MSPNNFRPIRFRPIRPLVAMLCLMGFLLASVPALAGDFQFTGTFTRDDQVQLFEVTIAPGQTVTFRTLSYAGGTTAAGQAVARGGFDPTLAIAYISNGLVLIQKDDGAKGTSPVDPATGQAWDVYFQARQTDLGPGTYILILTQYDDAPKSFYLANRFQRDGKPTFTSSFPGPACPSGMFKDASADQNAPTNSGKSKSTQPSTNHCRDGHWALEVLNADSVTQVSSEPAMLALPKTATATQPKVLSADGLNKPCEAGGASAIVVDETGKMLPAPDCVRRSGPNGYPQHESEDPSAPPAIGLVEVTSPRNF